MPEQLEQGVQSVARSLCLEIRQANSLCHDYCQKFGIKSIAQEPPNLLRLNPMLG